MNKYQIQDIYILYTNYIWIVTILINGIIKITRIAEGKIFTFSRNFMARAQMRRILFTAKPQRIA